MDTQWHGLWVCQAKSRHNDVTAGVAPLMPTRYVTDQPVSFLKFKHESAKAVRGLEAALQRALDAVPASQDSNSLDVSDLRLPNPTDILQATDLNRLQQYLPPPPPASTPAAPPPGPDKHHKRNTKGQFAPSQGKKRQRTTAPAKRGAGTGAAAAAAAAAAAVAPGGTEQPVVEAGTVVVAGAAIDALPVASDRAGAVEPAGAVGRDTVVFGDAAAPADAEGPSAVVLAPVGPAPVGAVEHAPVALGHPTVPEEEAAGLAAAQLQGGGAVQPTGLVGAVKPADTGIPQAQGVGSADRGCTGQDHAGAAQVDTAQQVAGQEDPAAQAAAAPAAEPSAQPGQPGQPAAAPSQDPCVWVYESLGVAEPYTAVSQAQAGTHVAVLANAAVTELRGRWEARVAAALPWSATLQRCVRSRRSVPGHGGGGGAGGGGDRHDTGVAGASGEQQTDTVTKDPHMVCHSLWDTYSARFRTVATETETASAHPGSPARTLARTPGRIRGTPQQTPYGIQPQREHDQPQQQEGHVQAAAEGVRQLDADAPAQGDILGATQGAQQKAGEARAAGAAESADVDWRQEVLVTVSVYTARRNDTIDEEYVCLGSQPLSCLRSYVRCVAQLNLEAAGQQGSGAAYFFFEGRFYNDTRDPGALDLSAPIVELFRSRMQVPLHMDPRLGSRVMVSRPLTEVAATMAVLECTGAGPAEGTGTGEQQEHEQDAEQGQNRPVQPQAGETPAGTLPAQHKPAQPAQAPRVIDLTGGAAGQEGSDMDVDRPEQPQHAQRAEQPAQHVWPQALPMQDSQFEQLTCRLSNAPLYLYCHLGCCEHLVQVRDVRRMHPGDPAARASYPLRSLQPDRPLRPLRRCDVCESNPTDQVAYNDPSALFNPTFYCRSCLNLLHPQGLPPGCEVYPYKA